MAVFNVIDDIGKQMGVPRETSQIPAAFPGWGPYTVPETDFEYSLRLLKLLYSFWQENHQPKKGKKSATSTKG